MSDTEEERQTGSAPTALVGLSEEQLRDVIEDALDRLSVENLTAIVEAAQDKRREKEDVVKEALLREFRERAASLGLRVNLVPMDAPMSGGSGRKPRRDAGQPLPVRYRGPDGQQWSGRGVSPRWIREHEEKGGNKEDYRVG
jgi:DNA-binding protein H-NS